MLRRMALEAALSILLVDDDGDLRDLMTRILRFGGCTVAQAAGGRAALSALGALPHPDVVVTDLMMPGMSGGDLVRQLRADPSMTNLRILVVSGNADSREGMDVAALVQGVMNKDALAHALLPAVRAAALSPAAA